MTLFELLPSRCHRGGLLVLAHPAELSARRKAQAQLVASLEPGQRIMTTAGVFGTLTALDGERVGVEVAPGVVIEMLAAAVAQTVPADLGPADEAPDVLEAGADRAGAARADGARRGAGRGGRPWLAPLRRTARGGCSGRC